MLLCLVYLTSLASFFLPSHLSLQHVLNNNIIMSIPKVYMYTYCVYTIGKLYIALVWFLKARLVRKYPASIWEDTTALEEKSLEATEWLVCEISVPTVM